jgi:hypothetical protein
MRGRPPRERAGPSASSRVPVQDFATVGRAALHGDPAAVSRLQYVAFDLLAHATEDVSTITEIPQF